MSAFKHGSIKYNVATCAFRTQAKYMLRDKMNTLMILDSR
jgi:hypothetical protein